jgi:hypothetical protein
VKLGPMPQEHKDNLSKSKTGVKLGPMPHEQKDKISKSKTGVKRGRTPSSVPSRPITNRCGRVVLNLRLDDFHLYSHDPAKGGRRNESIDSPSNHLLYSFSCRN